MDKIIIEVGSTCSKIDKYSEEGVKHLEKVVIEFKKNYKKENKLDREDIDLLIEKVNKYSKENSVYICGTSVFRDLSDNKKQEFIKDFYNRTGQEFNIINQEEENRLTVLGATKNVKGRVAVFVGGGGSTEISIYDNGITEMINTEFGVIDIMNIYEDLAYDIATTDLEIIKSEIRKKLKLPKQKADILILAGGGHLNFALNSGINYEENSLYKDNMSPIMMDIETRKIDTLRYYKEISLDEIRKRVDDPNWWYATRAMSAFVLVVAEEIGAKYIIPTDISMVHGIKF